MKKSLIHIAIPFLLFLFCFNAIPAEKATGPRILIEETTFDAKEVTQGERILHTFKVINVGDQALEINKVKPG
jgi:hypothetical protein